MKPHEVKKGRKYWGGPKGHGRFVFGVSGDTVRFAEDDSFDSESRRKLPMSEFLAWIAEWEKQGKDPTVPPHLTRKQLLDRRTLSTGETSEDDED